MKDNTLIMFETIDIDTRRQHGIFYTPKIWVDYAHERITSVLGENWKEEFVVWDNCAGTCNLTKDYNFKELYISTLFDHEVEEGLQYNSEAVHFQFDFLNDDMPNPQALFNTETKLPEGLLDAFKKNKKILFLINPPYAAGTNRDGSKGTSATKTNQEMIADGYGKSAQNLYTQFLYRIEKIKQAYKLKECYIGIFCPTGFLSGSSYEKFREYFLNDFEYKDGFQFQASHFADVSATWGIGFTIWKSGISKNKDNFEIDICDVNKNSYTGEIQKEDTKCIYNIDDKKPASIWIREGVIDIKTQDAPQMKSGINIKTSGNTMMGRLVPGALGYMFSGGNNIDSNAVNVALFTSCYAMGHGVSIVKNNFLRCITLFSARKLIMPNWINSKDEYLAPDESNPNYEEFVNDSIIFSLFHIHDNCSSLRNVDYKDSQWDIKNEFFWMSKKEIADLADKNDNEECYDDAITSDDRFVYKYLQKITLSPEAQAVLDYATKLVRDSFKYRDMFNDDYPKYQINNWDCGFYQLKFMWQEYIPEEFKQFKLLYEKLADKMRPMVYELGFLKK